jgi:tripartite ATP-independent transporter DctM subunit
MSSIEIGVFGIVGFLLLLSLGVPIGLSFATAGIMGIIVIQGLVPGLNLLGQAFYTWTSSYVLCTIPLFVLMGQFAFHSGISGDLYTAAYRWIGRLPGGLALATNIACTGFAACTGSSVASAATMTVIAYPEMQKANYDPRLSTGCIAAGGTLGILIPPSTIFIVYGIITETSINELFIAGILPGLLISALFCGLIFVMCKRNPQLGPPGESFSWKEKLSCLKGVCWMLGLFILVIGGLYVGLFAPSEAGTIGAFGAFAMALAKKKLTKAAFLITLKETVQFTSFALFILIGAMIFSNFLTLSRLPEALTSWIATLPVPPFVILLMIIALYIPLGAIMEPLDTILLTIPIVFPIILKLGFDPVWFGVLIVIISELSLITPPVAMNLYVVQGITKVPFEVISRGILPFLVVLVFGLIILVAFPEISLFLPRTMK